MYKIYADGDNLNDADDNTDYNDNRDDDRSAHPPTLGQI